MEKYKVGIYTQRFLYPVNTFIHRQINGVSGNFIPVLLTSNKSIVKGEKPDYRIVEKTITATGRLYRIWRKLSGDYAVLSSSQIKFFEEFIAKENIKLIHAHYGPSGIEIVRLAERLKLPLIVSFHGYDASHLLNSERYLKQLREVFNYAHLITVSKYMAEKLIGAGAGEDKLNIIYYGVNAENKFVKRRLIQQKVRSKEEIIFLQISNFVEKKGHLYTLQAFGKFLQYYSNCKLILGGAGPLLNKIKETASNLNLNDNVKFLGAVRPDLVTGHMAEADIFLHHSVTAENGSKEGIPNVIMEAMSTGLPVISTYHAGIPELIEDGVNGFLVKEKNIEEYVDAMKGMFNTDINLSENAAKTIEERFNLIKQNKKIIELYNKVIES